MSKRNFPSFIQAFLEYSKNVGAPNKFLLWSAISGVAAALERKTWVHHNGIQVIYPNLYVMLIADSGIAKKSTSTRPIMEIISGTDGISRMSTQMSGASLVKQLAQSGEAKTFEFNGTKYKNSSLFAFSSEARVTIGGRSGLEGVQELLTDFYDCGEVNIWNDKKPAWSKETVGAGKTDIYNPCLNFLACSTPAWLNECIGKNGIEGGFASRILFINQHKRVDSPDLLEDGELVENVDDVKKLLIEDLNQICKLQGVYKKTTEFVKTYNKLKRETEGKIDLGGEMKAYYSRKMWHLMKLSQVLAADQSDIMILTHEHLLYANEILESIEDNMYDAFSMQTENKQYASLICVWNFIRKKPVGATWTRQTIHSGTHKIAPLALLDDHFRSLAVQGKIKMIQSNGVIGCEILDNSPLGRQNEIA